MQTLHQKQELPISKERAWAFFSDPRNLQRITPPYMGFDILTDPLPDKVYPGMVIIYRVRPLWGIPMKWVTEITQVMEPDFFIDNQKSGPYAYWHHQHFINETDTGTEIMDIINFKVPFGIVGRILEKAIVKRKVQEIFEYRKKKLEELFPA